MTRWPAFGRARYFTSLDAASGYWQVPVREEDQDKTTFVCSRGLFKFRVMPFGLCNAPATFQRMMDVLFAGLHGKCVQVYIDDIIVYSDTWEEHVAHLREVLARLRRFNLKLKLSKCNFVQALVAFLGHIVSAGGVRPDPKKVAAICNAEAPTDVTQLRAFLGLASYYRRFIAGFATIAAPLHGLLKKGVEYLWTDACQRAFDALKASLTSTSMVRQPDFSRAFWLFTDASTVGIGAVLAQKDDAAQEYVIAYASRTLMSAEKNYSTTERECLALVWATKEWRHYLLGAAFHVVTDHNPLRWLMEMKDPSGRLARWSLKLQEFTFTVQHRRGLVHSNADALSRAPIVRTESDSHGPVPAVADREQQATTPAATVVGTTVALRQVCAGTHHR